MAIEQAVDRTCMARSWLAWTRSGWFPCSWVRHNAGRAIHAGARKVDDDAWSVPRRGPAGRRRWRCANTGDTLFMQLAQQLDLAGAACCTRELELGAELMSTAGPREATRCQDCGYLHRLLLGDLG
ncbi:Os06g0689650 [Oryza sativa Japonica Group]|uniref:Os06g0689650 protein n=1 Tax=Oryza sativa subsp. japonica TaxID=39947 RepID=A0A0P0X060_ORYSJ|nr:Os06g0689650 [Oryza sativa Japonica Group]